MQLEESSKSLILTNLVQRILIWQMNNSVLSKNKLKKSNWPSKIKKPKSNHWKWNYSTWLRKTHNINHFDDPKINLIIITALFGINYNF